MFETQIKFLTPADDNFGLLDIAWEKLAGVELAEKKHS